MLRNCRRNFSCENITHITFNEPLSNIWPITVKIQQNYKDGNFINPKSVQNCPPFCHVSGTIFESQDSYSHHCCLDTYWDLTLGTNSVASPICQEGQSVQNFLILAFSSRFVLFFPFFSWFFPLFPDFWQFFRCQGWHSAPPLGLEILLKNLTTHNDHLNMANIAHHA